MTWTPSNNHDTFCELLHFPMLVDQEGSRMPCKEPIIYAQATDILCIFLTYQSININK